MDKAKRALESYNLANPKVESVKVKRPVTGFIRFASEKRPELLSKSPDLKSNVAAQSKIFSAMWKALDESTKAVSYSPINMYFTFFLVKYSHF